MQIQCLGTSSGSPSIHRNVSATAVGFDHSKEWILVDCGEGTQHQLLKSQFTVYRLSLICISHIHGDHCYGLPGLLASMSLSGRKKPVDFIAPKSVIDFVTMTMGMTGLSLGFDLRTHAIEFISDALDNDLCVLEVIPLQHRVPSYGFKFTEKGVPNKLKVNELAKDGIPSGPHFNQLQKGYDVIYNNMTLHADKYTYPSWRPRVAIICGDNEKPSLLSPYIEDIDVLLHEATFTQYDLHQVGTHTGHSDAKRVAMFAQKYKLPLLVLFHFSARYHGAGQLDKLKNEALTYFQGELVLAQDFDLIHIAKNVSK